MPSPLSPEDVRRYERDGYVYPLSVLHPEEVTSALSSLDRITSTCEVSALRLPLAHQYFRWAFDLATNPALLDAVESVIGPDIMIWGTLILSKAAHSRSIASWHQDSSYARFLDGAPALSAWIALTPATVESGCMRVIPGTQDRQLPFRRERHPDDMLIRGLQIEADFDASRAVDLVLEPGQASLHEISLIHGSGPNHSALPRTGFIARFSTPDMRDPGYPVHSVRGRRCPFASTPDWTDSAPENFAAYTEYLGAERAAN